MKRKNYLEKVLFAEDDYVTAKLTLVDYLNHILSKIEDFDNPLYTHKNNDGGPTHIGSIDWFANQIPSLVIEMRQRRDFEKTTRERKHEILAKLK